MALYIFYQILLPDLPFKLYISSHLSRHFYIAIGAWQCRWVHPDQDCYHAVVLIKLIFLKWLFMLEGKLVLVAAASSFPNRVTMYTPSKGRAKEGTALDKIGCVELYVRCKDTNDLLHYLNWGCTLPVDKFSFFPFPYY